MNENDLNYTLNKYEHVKTNLIKNVFYNCKTSRFIKVVLNCRSFGIWVGRKFIPLSKIETSPILIIEPLTLAEKMVAEIELILKQK